MYLHTSSYCFFSRSRDDTSIVRVSASNSYTLREFKIENVARVTYFFRFRFSRRSSEFRGYFPRPVQSHSNRPRFYSESIRTRGLNDGGSDLQKPSLALVVILRKILHFDLSLLFSIHSVSSFVFLPKLYFSRLQLTLIYVFISFSFLFSSDFFSLFLSFYCHVKGCSRKLELKLIFGSTWHSE